MRSDLLHPTVCNPVYLASVRLIRIVESAEKFHCNMPGDYLVSFELRGGVVFKWPFLLSALRLSHTAIARADVGPNAGIGICGRDMKGRKRSIKASQRVYRGKFRSRLGVSHLLCTWRVFQDPTKHSFSPQRIMIMRDLFSQVRIVDARWLHLPYRTFWHVAIHVIEDITGASVQIVQQTLFSSRTVDTLL